MTLFHGTSRTEPVLIFNAAEGFDHRYANKEGLWGEGIYFASNARYSHDWAFRPAAGSAPPSAPGREVRQMLVAQVLVGHAYDAGTTKMKGIKKPPNKPNANVNSDSGSSSVAAAGAPKLEGELYDSVRCEHLQSINYIVYASGRAYPDLLLTYEYPTE